MTVCIKCRESDCECGEPVIQPAEKGLDHVNEVRRRLAEIKAKKEGRK